MAGFSGTLVFFGRKIKGTISFLCGLVFIVTGVKFIGILFQVYGIYEFFKYYIIFQLFRAFAGRVLVWMEEIPVIGPYISKIYHNNINYRKIHF
jgi:hypothetical protein